MATLKDFQTHYVSSTNQICLLHSKGILMNINECCCCYPASTHCLGPPVTFSYCHIYRLNRTARFNTGAFNLIKLYQISFLDVRRLLSNDHIFPRGSLSIVQLYPFLQKVHCVVLISGCGGKCNRI